MFSSRRYYALVVFFLSHVMAFDVVASCIEPFNTSLRQLHSQNMLDFCELVEGKPLLIVNTASHCGFTPQFEGLEKIYKDYKDKELVVVGFTSNDFFQAAKSEEKAAEVCFKNFGVSFTMLAPTSVRGKDVNPVFAWLAEESRKPSWNFNKYLVTADRQQVTRLGSRTSPDSPEFIDAVEQLF